MRTAAPVSFTLDLSGRTGPRPDQVARALVEVIASGQVHDGDRLPSTRTLAATFGLARTAVVGAYEELTAAGFLVARPGGATYIEQGAAAAAQAGAFGVGNDGAPSGPGVSRSTGHRGYQAYRAPGCRGVPGHRGVAGRPGQFGRGRSGWRRRHPSGRIRRGTDRSSMTCGPGWPTLA